MSAASIVIPIPQKRGLYYGGTWHDGPGMAEVEIHSPATGELLAKIIQGSSEHVPSITSAARSGFLVWRETPPLERARILREMAAIVRRNSEDLALLDAIDCGNPVAELRKDVEISAFYMDFHAGLVTEMKGSSVPQGPNGLSFSVREPQGVVVRIAPFNHPAIFAIGRTAAPLAAGNSIIVKPPDQAPLSALRFAELVEGLLPPGVLNVVPGDRKFGAALVADPIVAMVAVTGSIPTGKSIMRSAADGIKRVLLELGGKNALVALPDADPDKVAAGAVAGMNFTWCGQSCGSTSRIFVHEDIYDAVIERLPAHAARFRPGLPTDPNTTMGSIVSQQQFDRVMGYIQSAKEQGARLVCGGSRSSDPSLNKGFFIEPTIFGEVTEDMRIAQEEIFGPVMSVFRWKDETDVMRQVNRVEYGLTFSVFTRDVVKAHRIAAAAEAGFCWINDVSHHVMGSPFGGYKQSGIGSEECLAELLAYTQEKNIYVNLVA